MKMRRKMVLIGIFSLVVITVVIAIVRAEVVSSETRLLDTAWCYMWSAIETTVGRCSKFFSLDCMEIVS